jgi:hypothetical protein
LDHARIEVVSRQGQRGGTFLLEHGSD